MGNRYFRRGKSKVLFGLEVTDKAAPSREDLDAAVDLSPDVAELNGFELSNDPIGTPNLADQFTPQIDGEDTVAASSITFYDRDGDGTGPGGEVIRDSVEKGTIGYVFFLPYGDTDGSRMEVWPVKSNGVNDNWSTGNEAARFNTPFSVREVPEQNAEVPAAGT